MNSISNLHADRAASPTTRLEIAGQDDTLRQASREVEGMFISLLLKQGLQIDSQNEAEAGFHESLQEFAIEQTATEIGQGEGCGIADIIYEQLLGNAQSPISIPGTASTRKGPPHHAK